MTDSIRMPLGDVTSSSNILQNVESKLSSQILIDLSNEYIPVKTVSEMKMSIETRPKTGIIKPKPPPRQRGPATKKGVPKSKKTKIEIEFEKLTASEQLRFLQSKSTLLQTLEVNSKDELEIQENSKVIETVENATGELCSLRLELGAVLSSEAELRAKERKLRLMIKRVQRKMIMEQSPLMCKRREEEPSDRVMDSIFPPSVMSEVQAFSRKACNGDRQENGLWCLAQQACGFEARVLPRLLDEQRDATLIRDCPAAVSSATTVTAGSTTTATTAVSTTATTAISTTAGCADAAELTLDAHSKLSSNTMHNAVKPLSTEIVSRAPIAEALTNTANADLAISLSTSKSMDRIALDSFGGDSDSLEVDIYTPCDDCSSSEEAAAEGQCVVAMAPGLPNDAVPAVCVAGNGSTVPVLEQALTVGKRSGVFHQFAYSAEENHLMEETVPVCKKQKYTLLEASLAVPAVRASTLPVCSEKPAAVCYPMFSQERLRSVELIDLTSPEAGTTASKASLQNTTGAESAHVAPVSYVSMNGATVPIDSTGVGAVSSLSAVAALHVGDTSSSGKEEESTLDSCFNAAVIHYRPPGYVSQDSHQDSAVAGSSADAPAVDSHEVERLQDSQLSNSTDSSGHAAPRSPVNSEQLAAIAAICNNLLSSPQQPDFSALPVQRLREVVRYYGLRVDTKNRMVSLLQAMWQRLHS